MIGRQLRMLAKHVHLDALTLTVTFTVGLFFIAVLLVPSLATAQDSKLSAATHETVLHVFNPQGVDETVPWANLVRDAAGLVIDGAGNLYGTAGIGGPNFYGAVFELSCSGQGWTEEVLYSFSGGTDGGYPYASLIFDHAGNLYSTAYSGGSWNLGTVFDLTPIQGS